jgi:hypothetical protein
MENGDIHKKQKIHLEDIEKKQVFEVPDQYFDNLSASIRRTINAKQPRIFSFSPVSFSLALAAMCLILIAGWYSWPKGSQKNTPYQIISDVANQEIIEYLQLYELAQYEIVEVAVSANVPLESQFLEHAEIDTDLLIDEAEEEIIGDFI